MSEQHWKINESSMVGFKKKYADLHWLSPFIFTVMMAISFIIIYQFIHIPLIKIQSSPPKQEKPPVIIEIANIPETRHIVRRPPPQNPLHLPSNPIEADFAIELDDVTIEDTDLDLDAGPDMPDNVIIVPEVEETEDEIYEYHAVEEPPRPAASPAIPQYPEIARRANMEGTVILKALVNRDGVIDSLTVESGPRVFHDAALEAARSTRFNPAQQNGEPVSCWVILPYNFELR